MIYNIDAMCNHMRFKREDMKDTYIYNDLTHWDECSKECKKLIYQAVQENVDYFKKFQRCNISITLGTSFLYWSFKEMYYFLNRWSNSIKGFYGRDYDNLQKILVEGLGRTCKLSLIRNKINEDYYYIFSLWDIDKDKKCYFSTTSTDRILTEDELMCIVQSIKEEV